MRAKSASDTPPLAHAWDSGGTIDVRISLRGRESSRLEQRGERVLRVVGSAGSIGGHETTIDAGHDDPALSGELHVSAERRTR